MDRQPLAVLAWLLLACDASAHGGIAPPGLPGYPAALLAPPSPNRLPVCMEAGANSPCGRTTECLLGESSQPLGPDENRYRRGQSFDLPWLISVPHGDDNLLFVTLRHRDSGTEVELLAAFPQGRGRSAGEIVGVGPMQIPFGFPSGEAVLEAWNQTAGDPYVDCLDLIIVAEELFTNGFED